MASLTELENRKARPPGAVPFGSAAVASNNRLPNSTTVRVRSMLAASRRIASLSNRARSSDSSRVSGPGQLRNAAEAVARLKQDLDGDLLVMGSGELLRFLMPYHLVGEYRLIIHPLVAATASDCSLKACHAPACN